MPILVKLDQKSDQWQKVKLMEILKYQSLWHMISVDHTLLYIFISSCVPDFQNISQIKLYKGTDLHLLTFVFSNSEKKKNVAAHTQDSSKY